MREPFPYDEAADSAARGRSADERRGAIPPIVSPLFPRGQEIPIVRPPRQSPQAPTSPGAFGATPRMEQAPGGQGVANTDQETPHTLRGAWPAPGAQEAMRMDASAASHDADRTPGAGQGWPLAGEARQRADADAPTNIYQLAQYTYQLSVTAAAMDDHELGLLLPRSGRIWFNIKLFNDPPSGRALAQRDAWWRVIDASPAVRFLLGWCVAVYRTAQFDRAPRQSLPGRGRVLYFSQPETAPTAMRLQFWSDIARDVTEMFAPAARIWRQIQSFAQIPTGERRWAARLTMAGYSPDETLAYLADRNNCAASLIRRTLAGNPALNSYADYQRFTEDLLADLPRLRMQRIIAMQRAGFTPASQRAADREQTPPRGHPANLMRNRWAAAMPDPRQDVHFWQLHL